MSIMSPRSLASITLLAAQLHTPNAAPQDAPIPPELCSLEGRVAGAIKGEPVRKATLILLQNDGTQGQPYSTTANSSGSFAMRDIEPGKYKLMVMRGGYATMQYGARGSGRPGITLSLDPGQHVRDLLVRLTPQAVIAGRVLDEDGDPVAN